MAAERSEHVVGALDERQQRVLAALHGASGRRCDEVAVRSRRTIGCAAGEVDPERRAARPAAQVARCDRLERLRQRRLTACSWSRTVAEPRHRREQQCRRLGGRLRELGDEPARVLASTSQRSASISGDDRRGDRVPAPTSSSTSPAGWAQTSLSNAAGRLPRHALGVSSASSSTTLASRKLTSRSTIALGCGAQRVDEVALERGQPPEDVFVAVLSVLST
jgi:hypothetical protein